MNTYTFVGALVIAGLYLLLRFLEMRFVLKENKPFLVIGSPGGSTIITTTMQTILIVIDYEMDIKEAVSSPRFHSQWLPDAIQIEATTGGIKLISTGQNTGDDIYVKASKSFSLIADETASDAINISATAGGINILSSAQPENDINIKSTGASINIESTEDVTDAIMIKASNGGVAILSQGTTEGDDIDLISTTSINLFASEDKADSININSVNGGIDITANGDPGQDIDITNTGG